jgi:hypothetical protein
VEAGGNTVLAVGAIASAAGARATCATSWLFPQPVANIETEHASARPRTIATV